MPGENMSAHEETGYSRDPREINDLNRQALAESLGMPVSSTWGEISREQVRRGAEDAKTPESAQPSRPSTTEPLLEARPIEPKTSNETDDQTAA